VIPKDPNYLLENYVEHPWQNDFQDWLMGYINHRPRPEIPLAHYLSVEPMLDLDRAREWFGEPRVRAALLRL